MLVKSAAERGAFLLTKHPVELSDDAKLLRPLWCVDFARRDFGSLSRIGTVEACSDNGGARDRGRRNPVPTGNPHHVRPNPDRGAPLASVACLRDAFRIDGQKPHGGSNSFINSPTEAT